MSDSNSYFADFLDMYALHSWSGLTLNYHIANNGTIRCMAHKACQKSDGERRDSPPPFLGLTCPDGHKHSFSAEQSKFCLTEPYIAFVLPGVV